MEEYKQIKGLWGKKLKKEWNKPYFIQLSKELEKRREQENVYPDPKQVFESFRQVPLEKVKVVILGQDPYHQKGQAIGVAFAAKNGNKIPPSLRNIYKEIESDTKGSPADLFDLQKQGVFLLNTILTVSENAPLSHKNIGWECFVDKVLEVLWQKKEKIVFLLWGNQAKKRVEKIFQEERGHLVLTAAHPSPLSCRKFFGCKHFTKANTFLQQQGVEIDWNKR